MSAPSDAELWRYVRRTLHVYAREFGLPLRKVERMASHKDFYGDCSSDGRIRIQLRRNGDRPIAYQIIDTMAHELAHLEHQNHKRLWFSLHVIILHRLLDDLVYDDLRRLCKKAR
jgi:predicted metal-dependent hydrolase